MLSGETMTQMRDAVMEMFSAMGKCRTDAELAVGSYFGMKEFLGIPVHLDLSLLPDELHIRYIDEIGRPHTTKVFNIGDELEAYRASKDARRIGPQTVEEILADFEDRKRLDDAMMRDSLAEFERGEITEDEIYRGDALLQGKSYPIVFESKVREQKIGVWYPFPVDLLKENAKLIDQIAVPRAEVIIQTEALKYLQSLK